MKQPKIILISLLSIFVLTSSLKAQRQLSVSLREAQVYALEHNYDVINALTDIEIAKKKVKETISTGLPQVNGSISYNDYLEIPTQLIPGEFFGLPEGEFAEVKFGTQHNATWGGTVNQMIFNGQYVVGLQASKAYLSLSETAYKKTEIEIKDMIAKAYYPVIILGENLLVFDSTLSSLQDMLYETREYYNAGFVEDTDIDQLELLVSDIEATKSNMQNQYEIAVNTMKYLMGLDMDTDLELTDNIDDLLIDVNQEYLGASQFDYKQHIDFIMIDRQAEIAQLNLKLQKSAYLPMVNAFYTYSQNAMRNEFNFFDSNENWYNTQILGVQLDVPIFSSGNKHFKVQQAQLELEKIRVSQEQMRNGLGLKVKTVRSDFNNSYLIYMNKKLALRNADRIYTKTETKYTEGISTSLELSQTYNQYLNSQVDYLASILDLLTKKANLEKELLKVEY